MQKSLAYRHRWFIIVVILPTILAAIYYGIIASDIYVSESRFVIRSSAQRTPQLSTVANLLQTTGFSTGQEQSNEVLEYIRSRNLLSDLGKQIDVRAIYMRPRGDFLTRYPSPWSPDRFETLYRYYGGMVEDRFDADTGTAVLTAKAFTPKDAYAINAHILELSEHFVNQLNDRAQQQAVADAERRVGQAENRLRRAHAALTTYRNAQGIVDPSKQATGVFEVSNALVAQQAALKAQLELMEHVTPANPALSSLRKRVAAINEQIASQNARAVGTKSALASKIGEFESLVAEQEFATQMLTASNAALTQATAEAQKQQFYLERVVEPNLSDMPLLPHRIRQVFVVMAAALAVYMILWMLVVGILEHAPED